MCGPDGPRAIRPTPGRHPPCARTCLHEYWCNRRTGAVRRRRRWCDRRTRTRPSERSVVRSSKRGPIYRQARGTNLEPVGPTGRSRGTILELRDFSRSIGWVEGVEPPASRPVRIYGRSSADSNPPSPPLDRIARPLSRLEPLSVPTTVEPTGGSTIAIYAVRSPRRRPPYLFSTHVVPVRLKIPMILPALVHISRPVGIARSTFSLPTSRITCW